MIEEDLIPIILEVIDAIREAYSPFVLSGGTSQPTDTLVTKVLLERLALFRLAIDILSMDSRAPASAIRT